MSNGNHSFLLQTVSFLRKWRRFLIVNISAFTLIALVISLLLPKSYRAEARILTRDSDIANLGLSTLAEDLPFGGLGLIPKGDQTLRYLAMLESRTVMMAIADRFHLQDHYDTPNWEKTLKKLIQNISIESNIDETISIHAWDKSPEFAAKLANAFVKTLDSLNIQLKVAKAKNNRQFLKSRLEEIRVALTSAEESLKNFQEQYGVIEVTEQARAVIQTISELEAQIIVKETELRFKRNFLSEYHTEINKLEKEVAELRISMQKIQQGTDSNALGSGNIIIPSRKVPGLAMKYFRLLRVVEVQNLLFKLMTEQFEQARILEAKETPTIQVLDWAVPPVYKDRPKRSYIVLGAFFFSAFISLFFAAALEKWRRLKAELKEQTNSNDK